MWNSRQDIRSQYINSWKKYHNNETLSSLEQQIVSIISRHPEYHHLIEDTHTEERDFNTTQNPFLHMGLHLAIRDQIQTNSPNGIQKIYQQLLGSIGDQHEVEHRMMECLAQYIWETQQQNVTAIDLMTLLEKIKV